MKDCCVIKYNNLVIDNILIGKLNNQNNYSSLPLRYKFNEKKLPLIIQTGLVNIVDINYNEIRKNYIDVNLIDTLFSKLLNDIDEYLINTLSDKSKSLFGENKDKLFLSEFFKRTIFYSNKTRFNLISNSDDEKIDTLIFNYNKESISINDINKNDNVKMLIRIDSIIFENNNFSINYLVEQIQLQKKIIVSRFLTDCHIQDDTIVDKNYYSNEDELSEELNKEIEDVIEDDMVDDIEEEKKELIKKDLIEKNFNKQNNLELEKDLEEDFQERIKLEEQLQLEKQLNEQQEENEEQQEENEEEHEEEQEEQEEHEEEQEENEEEQEEQEEDDKLNKELIKKNLNENEEINFNIKNKIKKTVSSQIVNNLSDTSDEDDETLVNRIIELSNKN